MNLTIGEKKLFNLLLEYATHLISNRGCNDLSKEMLSCLSQKEWVELSKQYHKWNGDPEEHRDEHASRLPDYAVIYYFQKKLGLKG